MAHPEGFEPPTARFVAEYSIQLSYGCVFNFSLLVKGSSCFYYLNGAPDDFILRLNMAHPEGFEPPTARFVAEYSIQLSYGCVGLNGGERGIRTLDAALNRILP